MRNTLIRSNPLNARHNPEKSEEAPMPPFGSKPLPAAEPAPEPPLAEEAAEKLHAEGGGGFNPRIKPAKSMRASAPEEHSSSFSVDLYPFSAACKAPGSRLSGLRSRFASMGLKGLIKARAAAAEARKASPTVEAPPEPPVPARTYTPFPDDEPRHGAAVLSTSPLTASPDSRPPNDSAENTRRDRRDPFDAVEILPSLRGQYKKK